MTAQMNSSSQFISRRSNLGGSLANFPLRTCRKAGSAIKWNCRNPTKMPLNHGANKKHKPVHLVAPSSCRLSIEPYFCLFVFQSNIKLNAQ